MNNKLLKKDIIQANIRLKAELEILHSEKPSVKITNESKYGRGIIAARNISKGEIFLECPTIKLSPGDFSYTEKTILQCYMFSGPDMSPYSYIGLGVGSLFNHDERDSASYLVDESDNETLKFKAIQDISRGEEIFINYGWYD